MSLRPFVTLVFALLFLFSSPAFAGNVLYVGSSQQYRDIQAAVNAASSGDLIMVDPGVYSPFQVSSKSLSIVSSGGEQAPFTVQQVTGRSAIEVTTVLPGQTVSIFYAETDHLFGTNPAVNVELNFGTVRLKGVKVHLTRDQLNARAQAAIEVKQSSSVWFDNVHILPTAPRKGNTTTLTGGPIGTNDGLSALLAVDSELIVQRYRLFAYDHPAGRLSQRYAGDGLRLVRSKAWVLNDPTSEEYLPVFGGNGGDYGGSAVHLVNYPGHQSTVMNCGRAWYRPGEGGSRPGGYLAINNDRGRIVQGQTTLDRFVPSCLLVGVSWSSVSTATPAIGRRIDLGFNSFHSRTYASFVGSTLVSFSKPLPNMEGYPALDYAQPSTTLVGSGTSFSGLTSIALPNDRTLIGAQLALQGVTGPPQSQRQPEWAVSLPEMIVVLP